ncbi:FAD-dependent oxidoreductase [Ramlibacter sp. WS9]|uniref:FAD-dependent oxidoreductase n=1 Tax=Ramlibacter sp. WS9 TaxID=1882741 RepID=UPI0013051991|nr:FAD-dependent oxidoreductase [Ramlibacter sp. WS9]
MASSELEFDVIVVGGGPSGFIAATASARLGARTLLVERYGFLGGMPTSACIGPISPFHFGDEQVIAGIPQQFIDRMVDEGGSTGHAKATDPRGHGSYVCFYDRQLYKWVALQMVREAGAEVLLHTFVDDVIVEDGAVRGIVVTNKSGRTSLRAKVVVDASGDGDVAKAAGARHVLGREPDGVLQPVTLMFEMAGVDTAALKSYMDSHPEDFWRTSEIVPMRSFSPRLESRHFCGQGFVSAVRQAHEAGELSLGRDSVLFWTTVHQGVVHFNSTRVAGIDGTKASDLTRAEVEGRRQVMSLSNFLVTKIECFKDAWLSDTGIQVGVRETRHVVGEYVLTESDVVEGRKFDDVIARGYFPVDIHNPQPKAGAKQDGGVWRDLEDAYDIPYRCLVPESVDGLLVAGRAISASHEAHASFRTQGGVMAIGHAAGAAAALAATHRVQPRALEVGLLQQALLREGALLHRDHEQVAAQKQRAAAAVQAALDAGKISRRYLAIPPRD